jgi:ribose transport system ATP-binding protein
MDESKLVSLMLGRNVDAARSRDRVARAHEPVLSVRRLAGQQVHGLDFELGKGEVLGIAGLLGSGASSVLRLLFGAEARSGGEVQLFGAPHRPRTPHDAIVRGVGYLPPDRALESSFHGMTLRANLSAVNVSRYFRGLRLRHDREHDAASGAISQFMIRAASDQQGFNTLSGGNQQKVILARWLRDRPKLLLLDEPTQGVDAHARTEIHGLLRDAALAGTTQIVVSSDFEELCQLCDRVIVMAQGRRVAEIEGARLDSHRLTELAHFAPESVP